MVKVGRTVKVIEEFAKQLGEFLCEEVENDSGTFHEGGELDDLLEEAREMRGLFVFDKETCVRMVTEHPKMQEFLRLIAERAYDQVSYMGDYTGDENDD